MDDEIYYRMYGGGPTPTPSAPEKPADRDKRALKVLGGMKVHGTHVKRIELDGELMEVPTSAYVKLLEDQIKELRRIQRESDSRQARLIRAHNKTVEELKAIRIELQNKIDYRGT